MTLIVPLTLPGGGAVTDTVGGVVSPESGAGFSRMNDADRRHAVRVDEEEQVVAGRREVRVRRRRAPSPCRTPAVKLRNWKRWFMSNACVTDGERISETCAI